MKTAPKGWQVWLKLSRKTLAKDYSKQHHPLSIAVDMDCNGWNFQLMWQSYVFYFLDNIQWLEFSTDVVILIFDFLRHTLAGIFNRCGNPMFLTFKKYNSWNFQQKWQYYIFDFWNKTLKGRGLSGLDVWHPCLEWGLISKNSLHTESIWIHWLKLALNVKNQDNECLSLGFFTNIGIWYRYKPGQQNRQEISWHMLLSPTLKTKQDWMQEDDHGWWNKLHETLQYGQPWSQIIGRP